MPELLRGVARTAVVAGTATAVSGRVARRQNQRWSRQEEERYAEQAPPATPAADESLLDQLKQLGELKEQGILTDEEFREQKARLLGAEA